MMLRSGESLMRIKLIERIMCKMLIVNKPVINRVKILKMRRKRTMKKRKKMKRKRKKMKKKRRRKKKMVQKRKKKKKMMIADKL